RHHFLAPRTTHPRFDPAAHESAVQRRTRVGINPGDTALVLLSAALVLLMTPGLAFFYGGLVRHKHVLTIMMQSFISMGVVTTLWLLVGFSLAYSGDTFGLIGDLRAVGLQGVGLTPSSVYAPTVPYLAFFLFQVMFAII